MSRDILNQTRGLGVSSFLLITGMELVRKGGEKSRMGSGSFVVLPVTVSEAGQWLAFRPASAEGFTTD